MAQSNSNPLVYYASPGLMTDPQEYTHLFNGLPTKIPELVKVAQGLMLHIFWAERYGLKLSEERKQEVQLRFVVPQLARILELDNRPLTAVRPLEKKLVGNCRDFSVLMCAILRHQGVPARARCGFGTYFLPDHYEDHWVCEYWNANEERWILVDAQLDALQCQTLGIRFDPLDVPRDQFVVGGKAWQMCRAGEADPDKFGIFEWHGIWFVRGDLIRDFLALNKIEILPWDGGWGYLDRYDIEVTDENLNADVMDRIATLSLSGNEAFAEIRSTYETDKRFHIPADWNLRK
jgi:hypothetical protein